MAGWTNTNNIMKSEFLKIAGVKSDKAFYKKYPTEEAFFKAHPEAKKMIKKAQAGTSAVASYVNGMNNVPNMQNIIQEQTQSPGVNAGMFSSNSTPDYNQMYMNMSTEDEQLKQPSTLDVGNIVSKGAGVISGLSNIYSGLRAEKKAKKEAQKWAAVTNVQARAAESEDIDNYRMFSENMAKKRKAMMPVVTGEELFPVQGVGTNVLAKNGAEIANTFAPGTIYDDVGYEPLDDSNQVKQFEYGGYLPKAQTGLELGLASSALNLLGGGMSSGQNSNNMSINNAQLGQFASGIASNLGGNNATSGIGDVLTSPLKGIPGVGEFSGLIAAPLNLAGGLLNTNNRDRRKAEAKIKNNQNRMAAAQYRGNIQGQFGSYMEDGGNVNPQIISKLGGNNLMSLLASPNDADMLRAGGNVPMMEQGGDLNTHWGGYAEPMSYNPYLPDGGETVMFRGQSHEESDGQGNTGIGITFGNSPVEVERGEPAVKLKDGGTGEDNLTVYGNLMIPDYGVEILGDKKAKGRKFKNYIADISKTEAKQNKLIEKSVNTVDELDVKTPFDKLKFSSLQANILGGNMKLKDVADKKIKAADIQNAINDTAEEYSLVADDLAKGKIKIDKKAMNMREAMFGTKLTKAQGGDKVVKGRGDKWSYIQAGNTGNPVWDDSQRYENEWTPAVKSGLEDPERAKRMLEYINNSYSNESDKVKKSLNKFSTDADKIKFLLEEGTNREVGPIHHTLDAALRYTAPGMTAPLKEEPKKENTVKSTFETIKHKNNPWLNIGYQTLKGFLDKPYEEALSPNQLMGEYYALSANQVEPVQATPYTPQLRVPYDISYQDQLNEVTADQRATQRMIGYNPAVQANVAAQAYGVKSKILADQFRANQAMKDQVYSGNIATLNDAELKNLVIYDQQYQRQEQAKSNTKSIAQAALSSIGDKLAKHKADVRTYNVYKTLFPQYGFDRSGRGKFEGGYADFNIPQNQYPYLNDPNYALVKNSDGSLSFKLKNQITSKDQVVEKPVETPSMATNPINGNYSFYNDSDNFNLSPIQERDEMLPPKRTGGKIRKNYSQSSIVKAFK